MSVFESKTVYVVTADAFSTPLTIEDKATAYMVADGAVNGNVLAEHVPAGRYSDVSGAADAALVKVVWNVGGTDQITWKLDLTTAEFEEFVNLAKFAKYAEQIEGKGKPAGFVVETAAKRLFGKAIGVIPADQNRGKLPAEVHTLWTDTLTDDKRAGYLADAVAIANSETAN